METSKNKKIEIISSHTDVKESDKQEGIDVYGKKPLDENVEHTSKSMPEPTVDQIRRKEEILQKIASLEKAFKSTNYVGDKSLIEEEIIQLENELRKNPSDRRVSDGKIKTAKELAMEGKIAWREKGDTKISQVNEVTKTTSAKTENLSEEEKIRVELRKVKMPEEDIDNLLVKRTKEIEPATAVKEKILENKENKEKYSREELLNAAEIFCKFNSAAYYKNPEERTIAEERALVGLKAEHSEREIDAAVKVAGKRNELSDLKEQILRVKKEYKDAMDNTSVGTLVVKAKYDQQIQDIKRKIRLIDNDYNPLLRELKIANLDSQLKNLEKYRDHADFKEKVEDAELFALSIIQTEKIRYQDAKISANSTLNPKIWDKVKNGWKRTTETKLFQGYAKMGRGRRMAISAAMIGVSSVLVPVTLVGGAIALVGGGVGGYFLSKKVAQPLARKAYEHDSAKTLREQQEEMIGSKGVEKKVKNKNKGENKEKWWKNLFKKSESKNEEKEIVGAKESAEEMKLLEQLARGEIDSAEREKILGKIADFNIALCDKYTDKMRRDKKYYVANNVLGTVAAGLIAGRGARMMAGWIVGPGILDIAGTPKTDGGIIEGHPPKGGGGPEIENMPPKGGTAPVEPSGPKGDYVLPEVIVTPKTGGLEINEDILKMATVGEGEGVEHVLRRQLEMNPGKFGFTGDMGDKVAIHEWSGGKAHLIAIDQGYVEEGTESWVRDMGPDGPKGNPAYVLDIDTSGKPSITEYFEGKSSGTGGVNSPYEYSHDSPVPQRYVSAIDNTPDQTITDSDLGPKVDNLQPIDNLHTTHLDEYVDTSKIEGQPVNNVGSSTEAVSSGSTLSIGQEQVSDVYTKNIEHLFPENTVGVWSDVRTLPADQVIGFKNPGRLAGLTDYLNKLEETTGLKPKSGSLIQGPESVYKYVNRALQEAANTGKLNEVMLENFNPVNIIGEQSEKFNSMLHGLVHENLTELSGNIPKYSIVLGVSPEKITEALTGLEGTKDIVGSISKLAIEHPEQARLLSKILEAEPILNPETRAFKDALDLIINSKK